MSPRRPTDCHARVYLASERRERERRADREARIARALRHAGSPLPLPDSPVGARTIERAGEAATRYVRDGAGATARLDARMRPCVATHYDGDTSVTGPLIALRARVRPDLGGAQARVASAIATCDRLAHDRERFARLRAAREPGGSVWIAVDRAARRRFRAAIHRADALDRAGDLASAIETLLAT